MKRFAAVLLITAIFGAGPALAASGKKSGAPPQKKEEKKDVLSAETFAGLTLRSIGPAVTSGRITDLAVRSDDPSIYFVAAASGGVWKTEDHGTTWTPVFDGEGSYSIGCVTLDPNDPNVVWVGTGENNSQRSVSYGDGVYKSIDGGESWKKVGLGSSEHIGKILVDPRDSNTVYVAAQGPLWRAGGDRGLYKTTDGGATWKAVLTISENTGVTDVVMDPRDPDVLYAAAYQRRRRVWTLIDGGPESAIYKSTDAGATWSKLESGLPKKDMGRIGLAISPAAPSTVYAEIEAADDAGGFFRSTDAGASWEKRSDFVSGSPQYYQEIFADPQDADRVYAVDTWLRITEDGGKTFTKVGEDAKHVDNHVVWIDPRDTRHLLVGCDGGLYETYDRGATWQFEANLPITQFYKIALDDAEPFYHVYGGTQDNFTLGGPTRTRTVNGIVNSDWFVVTGGDGFQPRADPKDPNIVYGEAQYGNLVRLDRKTGEEIDITPQAGPGEPPLRWNWDSPLIISPHSHTRLYFAANRVFRSDDRGDSWRAVSPDLTRQIDRNQLDIMGRVWSVNAVAKNASTSFYGNIVSLAESPLVEGLLYAGTDDGLLQVSEDGGDNWRKVESFPGVPDRTYVSYLSTSPHDPDTVFAAFDNHKNGDFKPYLLKSTDRGRTWASIAGDLPKRGSVYCVVQDPEKPELLFAGTEFGVFFTLDGGGRWIELKGGMPTIAVRDLAIQRRENDLVLGTFGRGFYVLDDYTPLRQVDRESLEGKAILFPPRDAEMYIESHPLGLRGKAFLGDSFFTAPNPPFGAVFTYYLKDALQTREEKRRDAEMKVEKTGGDIDFPGWKELRAEAREEKPEILLTVKDAEGNVLRRLTGPTEAGFHRVAWDLRFPSPEPVSLEPPEKNPFSSPPIGPLAVPGTYTVELAARVSGKLEPLAGPQTFEAQPLGMGSLPPADRQALEAFERKTASLERAVAGASEVVDETQSRIDHLKVALRDAPAADAQLAEKVRSLERRLQDLRVGLEGDRVVAEHNEPTPPSISGRVQRIIQGHWTSTSAPTATQRASYDAAAQAFGKLLPELHTLVEVDLAKLEEEAEAAGAPWTPGRFPTWQPE